MEQRANEWFGKMRDTVFTTVTDTVKRNWHHDEEEKQSEKNPQKGQAVSSMENISVVLQQESKEEGDIHPITQTEKDVPTPPTTPPNKED